MRRLAILLVLAAAVAGCKIDVEVAFDLRTDGTGDITVAIETDSEFERIYGFTNRAFEDLVASRGAEAGLAFEVIERDDGNVYRASRSNLTASQLEDIAANLAPGLGSIDIKLRDDRVGVDASLRPLPDADDLAALFTVFDPSELQDDVTVELMVRAPGRAEVSTADRVDDGTYVWDIPMARQTKNVLLTTTLAPEEGEGSSMPWGLLILVSVLAIASLFLYSVRSASRELVPAPEEASPNATRQTERKLEPETEPEAEEELEPEGEVVLAGEDLDD